MITLAEVQACSEFYGIRPDVAALTIYAGDIMQQDGLWCGCGDEITMPTSMLDAPVFIDPQGQYCCWICAETKYAHLWLKGVL
jgi:hypothetical protein